MLSLPSWYKFISPLVKGLVFKCVHNPLKSPYSFQNPRILGTLLKRLHLGLTSPLLSKDDFSNVYLNSKIPVFILKIPVFSATADPERRAHTARLVVEQACAIPCLRADVACPCPSKAARSPQVAQIRAPIRGAVLREPGHKHAVETTGI